MKRLIMVNGTMGVGKTSTCRALLPLVEPAAFLDGDWCWTMSPFIVNDETKAMVLDNIACLLNRFLACSQYQTVIFCWVMQQQEILDEVLRRLSLEDVAVSVFRHRGGPAGKAGFGHCRRGPAAGCSGAKLRLPSPVPRNGHHLPGCERPYPAAGSTMDRGTRAVLTRRPFNCQSKSRDIVSSHTP